MILQTTHPLSCSPKILTMIFSMIMLVATGCSQALPFFDSGDAGALGDAAEPSESAPEEAPSVSPESNPPAVAGRPSFGSPGDEPEAPTPTPGPSPSPESSEPSPSPESSEPSPSPGGDPWVEVSDADRGEEVQNLPAGCEPSIPVLENGSMRQGAIDAPNDVDCFVVELAAVEEVQVLMQPSANIDLDLEIYDAAGHQVDASAQAAGRLEGVYQPSGQRTTVVVVVRGYLEATGAYDIWMNRVLDAGNTLESARFLTLASRSVEVNGAIGPADEDWYEIEIENAAIVTARLTEMGGDFDLEVHNINDVIGSSSGVEDEEVVAMASEGRLFVRVHRYAGVGSYHLTISLSDDT